MARYFNPTTTSVSSSSVSIKTVVGDSAYEVGATDGAIWVHVTGGDAAANGAGCIFVPENGTVEITADDGVTSFTAIRDSGDAKATVSQVLP